MTTRTYTDERRRANTDPSLHFNQHVSDECAEQDHAECHDQRCACPHHGAEFKLEHPALRSLSEAQGDTDV